MLILAHPSTLHHIELPQDSLSFCSFDPSSRALAMSVNPRGLTRSPSPSTAAPSPKRQKLSDQAGPSSASSSRTAHQPPPPPAATSFPSTSSTSLPVTFPSSTSTTGAVEDEPAAQALGTVQPNGAGVTKVNGADGIDLSNGSSSSARVNTDDVLLGSKEVGVDGSNGVSATTGTSETQLKQQDEKEESDDEEVEELPEPEKEEMDTSHGDMYLDTVRTLILSPRALLFISPSRLLLAFRRSPVKTWNLTSSASARNR